MANENKTTKGTAPTLAASNLSVTPGPGRRANLLRRIVDAVTRRYRTSAAAMMDIETIDPLFGLTAQDAQQVFNLARSGNYARLQFIYHEIERTDPTLLVCVTRRKSALSELDWKVVRSDERLHSAGVTPEMEKAQIEFLETFMARIENLPEAIEHLALAAFRGYSHVFPLWANAEKTQVRRFQLPNSWNFCWDKKAQAWLWNAQASSFFEPKAGDPNLKVIPEEDRVTITDEQAIDWPALMIFLRKSMGERNWGRFLEQFGIPPVILTMPELTQEDDEDKYLEGAQAIFEGRSGVVPFGTQVNWATEARGADPYQVFLDYQARQIVLMATGGILTSLAESGSGTLGGNAHQETWKQIAKRYVRIVSNAINRQLCAPVMKRVFPGQPILAEFKMETEADLTAGEVLDLAAKAHAAGFSMDETELSEQTGFTIKRDPAQDPNGGIGGGFPGGNGGPSGGVSPEIGKTSASGGGSLGAGPTGGAENRATQAETHTGALGADGTGKEKGGMPSAQDGVVANADEGAPKGQAERSAGEKLAAALQRDYADVAARIQAILDLPEEQRPEAAEKLSAEIDGLVPDDPQMAAVIAQEMLKAFDKQAADPQAVKNSQEGKCQAKGGPAECTDPDCPEGGAERVREMANDDGEGLDDAGKVRLKKGQASMDKIISSQADVMDAMEDEEGQIDFRWDVNGKVGIKHLIDRRNAYRDSFAKNNPGEELPISGEELARSIPSVIVRGERAKVGKGEKERIEIRHNGIKVILDKTIDGKPANRWVLSAMNIDKDAAGYRAAREFGEKKVSNAVDAGKGVNLLCPTR